MQIYQYLEGFIGLVWHVFVALAVRYHGTGECNSVTPWQQKNEWFALLFYSCVRLAKRSRPFSLP